MARRDNKKKGSTSSPRYSYKAGDHNVISDLSGFKMKRSEMRFTWEKFLVGATEEWEPKQPQLDLRGRDEKIAVKDTRPDSDPVFFVPTADDLSAI